LVVLGEDEGLAAVGNGIAIALFDGVGRFAARHLKVFAVNCQIRARSEANEVECIRAGEGFVEIVNAPDEAAFGVAPRAEVLDVEIADSEDGWSLGEFLAGFRPVLEPAIKRGAEEGERILRHECMFERDVLANDWEALG